MKPTARAASGETLTIVYNYRSPFCALIVDRLFDLPRRYRVRLDWRLAREVPRPSSLPITRDNPRFLYNRQDCERRAHWLGLPWQAPAWRLTDVDAATRLGQWLLEHRPEHFRAYSERVSRAYWCHGRNTSDADVVALLAQETSIAADDVALGMADDETMRTRLDETMEWCRDQGVLGVPFFILGEDRFWGSDRLPAVERALADRGLGPTPSGDDGILFASFGPALPLAGLEQRALVRRCLCRFEQDQGWSRVELGDVVLASPDTVLEGGQVTPALAALVGEGGRLFALGAALAIMATGSRRACIAVAAVAPSLEWKAPAPLSFAVDGQEQGLEPANALRAVEALQARASDLLQPGDLLCAPLRPPLAAGKGGEVRLGNEQLPVTAVRLSPLPAAGGNPVAAGSEIRSRQGDATRCR